jgi:hypothetical protein
MSHPQKHVSSTQGYRKDEWPELVGACAHEVIAGCV